MELVKASEQQSVRLASGASWTSSAQPADEQCCDDGLALDLESSKQSSRGFLVYFEVRDRVTCEALLCSCSIWWIPSAAGRTLCSPFLHFMALG